MTTESEIRFCVLSCFSSQHDGGVVVCLGSGHTQPQLCQGGAVCVQGGDSDLAGGYFLAVKAAPISRNVR